jgi:hydrogenase expression/formation protein HypC
MCLGIPMRVERAGEGRADCVGRHGQGAIDTTLIGDVEPGDWLLTWLGAARSRLDAAEAARIELALDALVAAQRAAAAGAAAQPFDAALFFPDLIGREPELPAHLKEAR